MMRYALLALCLSACHGKQELTAPPPPMRPEAEAAPPLAKEQKDCEPTDPQAELKPLTFDQRSIPEGTRLADEGYSSLNSSRSAEIDKITRQLTDLVASISQQSLSEAQSANVVAANIQHIFAVTEQTGEGTRSTATMVRELSRTAEELRQSVSRFKIA